MRYEHARALIDRSALEQQQGPGQQDSGIKLLKELGCVLPDAERDLLGV